VEPQVQRAKTMEPVLLLGKDRFSGIDVRIRVTGGGKSSQVYAVRQALAKAIVAYAQKCECRGHRRRAAAATSALPVSPGSCDEGGGTPGMETCRRQPAVRRVAAAVMLQPAGRSRGRRLKFEITRDA
jgi:hypothetical protein